MGHGAPRSPELRTGAYSAQGGGATWRLFHPRSGNLPNGAYSMRQDEAGDRYGSP
jgi:hypothetical protein